MKIGNHTFQEGHTHVMGILNVTPDSFSDGNKYNTVDRALKHVEQMVVDGVDLIDVGGESTRPGFTPVAEQDEIQRVVPVIREIKKRFDVPISIDTTKDGVAVAAMDAGAELVNDIWGFQKEPKIARAVAAYSASCCLMHNLDQPVYGNFMADVLDRLEDCIDTAIYYGVDKDKIMIDPGIGFAKSQEQNLYFTAHVGELKKTGFPVLLATSRKSMIGNTLDLPVDQRLEGTLATTALAVEAGCLFVRVHDVKENVRLIRMLEALGHSKLD